MYYLSLQDKLGDDNRVVLRHLGSLGEEGIQVHMGVGHIHGSTTQHIGGPHQTWVTHLITEGLGTLQP